MDHCPLRAPATGDSIVLRHGEERFSDQFGARDVWVFEHDGSYYMHYDAAGETGWLAALATSSDGVRWTKHGPVLSLGAPGETDSASASYGTTFYDGDRWHMFYLGTMNVTPDQLKTPSFPYLTLKATASGPAGPWVKQPDVVPFTVAEGTWYSHTASPGAVVRIGDEFVMIFSASTVDADGSTWRTLGVARTTDLDAPWTIDPDPLFPVTEQVENSSLYYDETTELWYLFTNHIGRDAEEDSLPPQGADEYTDAVWMYWAQDPLAFTTADKAVVVDALSSGWSRKVIGLPSVVRVGDRLAVYYDGSTRPGIGHGERDIAVAWMSLPLARPVQ